MTDEQFKAWAKSFLERTDTYSSWRGAAVEAIQVIEDERAKHERVLKMLEIAEGAMTNCRMQFADMMSRVKAPDAWMIQELDQAIAQIESLK